MFASCVLAAFLLIVAIILFTWFRRPELLLEYTMIIGTKLLGFESKYLLVGGGRKVSYIERGTATDDKPSMVLVHGFTGEKENWLLLLGCLPKDYCHIIVLDMPGHGHSDLPPPALPVTHETSVMLLHQFMIECGLVRRPVHLIGMSMGGLISGLYAREHPECVALLTLMCPGMISPERTQFIHEFLLGKCALLTESIDDLRRAFKMVMSKPLPVTDQLLKGLLAMRKKHDYFHRKVFREVLSRGGGDGEDADLRALEIKARDISVPTQVIWGREDQLLHVSGAKLLKSKLPNCYQVDILDTCGHMIPIDQPKHTANCLIAFRQLAAGRRDNWLIV